ncbi:unnamed protein product, partial [Closterium sp. Naga37s-1]
SKPLASTLKHSPLFPPPPPPHPPLPSSPSPSPHACVCALLAARGSLNQLCLWRYPSMAKLAEFTGHTARVLHLAQSPDGYTVVSAAADETLRFWNAFGDPDGDKKGGKGGGRGCERRIGGGGGGVAACDEDGVASARCSLLRSHIR